MFQMSTTGTYSIKMSEPTNPKYGNQRIQRHVFGKRSRLGDDRSDHLDEIHLALHCVSKNDDISNSQLLLFKGSIKDREVKVLIDCGANGNFISKALVTQQYLQSQPHKSFKIIYGNGNEEICDSSATVQLNIDEFSDNTRLSVANIFDYDIILGKPWLDNEQSDVRTQGRKHYFQTTNRRDNQRYTDFGDTNKTMYTQRKRTLSSAISEIRHTNRPK